MKKDGRKCETSESVLGDKKSVNLILAVEGKEMKQLIVEARSAKSQQEKLKVSKIELPLCKAKPQPGCPLGLSYW